MEPLPFTRAQRLLLGFGANMLGKVWVILGQLLSVPVLSHAWGADGFGVWLMLSAVPTYIALSGGGLGSAAAVEMTRRVAEGNRNGAVAAFQSVSVLTIGTSLVAVAVLIGTVSVLRTWYSWGPAALILGLYAIIALQCSVVSGAFRAAGRYAQGTTLLDALSLAEMLGALCVAAVGGHWTAAAAAYLTIRALGCWCYYLILHRAEPWVELGASQCSLATIRSLAMPAMSSSGIMLASALSIQGTLLAIGISLGPAAAAIFGTARTLARAPLQLANLATKATAPELALAFAHNERRTTSALLSLNVAFAAAITIPFFVALALAGPRVLHVISHGQFSATPFLFAALSATTIVMSLNEALSQSLHATNRQHRFVGYALLAGFLSVGLPFAMSSLGLGAIAFGLFAVEIAAMTQLVFVVHKTGFRIRPTDIREAISMVYTRGISMVRR